MFNLITLGVSVAALGVAAYSLSVSNELLKKAREQQRLEEAAREAAQWNREFGRKLFEATGGRGGWLW